MGKKRANQPGYIASRGADGRRVWKPESRRASSGAYDDEDILSRIGLDERASHHNDLFEDPDEEGFPAEIDLRRLSGEDNDDYDEDPFAKELADLGVTEDDFREITDGIEDIEDFDEDAEHSSWRDDFMDMKETRSVRNRTSRIGKRSVEENDSLDTLIENEMLDGFKDGVEEYINRNAESIKSEDEVREFLNSDGFKNAFVKELKDYQDDYFDKERNSYFRGDFYGYTDDEKFANAIGVVFDKEIMRRINES